MREKNASNECIVAFTLYDIHILILHNNLKMEYIYFIFLLHKNGKTR